MMPMAAHEGGGSATEKQDGQNTYAALTAPNAGKNATAGEEMTKISAR